MPRPWCSGGSGGSVGGLGLRLPQADPGILLGARLQRDAQAVVEPVHEAHGAGDERHLNAEVVDVLQQLGELRLADGDPAEALAAAERALRFDEDNESAQRLAMRAESALGLRETVVKRYERLSRRLSRRFGLEPEHDTRLLYRRLLSQDPGALAPQSEDRPVLATE